MDGDPIAIARMYKERAHWLQLDVNALHRQLSAFAQENNSLRKDNARLLAENARFQRRVREWQTGTANRANRGQTGTVTGFIFPALFTLPQRPCCDAPSH